MINIKNPETNQNLQTLNYEDNYNANSFHRDYDLYQYDSYSNIEERPSNTSYEKQQREVKQNLQQFLFEKFGYGYEEPVVTDRLSLENKKLKKEHAHSKQNGAIVAKLNGTDHASFQVSAGTLSTKQSGKYMYQAKKEENQKTKTENEQKPQLVDREEYNNTIVTMSKPEFLGRENHSSSKSYTSDNEFMSAIYKNRTEVLTTISIDVLLSMLNLLSFSLLSKRSLYWLPMLLATIVVLGWSAASLWTVHNNNMIYPSSNNWLKHFVTFRYVYTIFTVCVVSACCWVIGYALIKFDRGEGGMVHHTVYHVLCAIYYIVTHYAYLSKVYQWTSCIEYCILS